MCRLGVFDSSQLQNKGELARTFSELERSLGGHGNTLMLIGKHIEIEHDDIERIIPGEFETGEPYSIIHIKPLVKEVTVEYTTYSYKKGREKAKKSSYVKKEADLERWARLLERLDFSDTRKLIFHTRLTSTGTQDLRHPAQGGKWLLFQNGTIHFIRALELYFKSEWDTEIAVKLLDKASNYEDMYDMLLSLDSVWIAVEKKSGDIVVVKTSGALTTNKELTRIISEGEPYTLKNGSIIRIPKEGQIEISQEVDDVLKTEPKPITKYTGQAGYTYTGYGSYRFNDDDYYDEYQPHEAKPKNQTVYLDDGLAFVLTEEGMKCNLKLGYNMSLVEFHSVRWEDMIDKVRSDYVVVADWKEFVNLMKTELTNIFWLDMRDTEDYKNKPEFRNEVEENINITRLSDGQYDRFFELWLYFIATGLVDDTW